MSLECDPVRVKLTQFYLKKLREIGVGVCEELVDEDGNVVNTRDVSCSDDENDVVMKTKCHVRYHVKCVVKSPKKKETSEEEKLERKRASVRKSLKKYYENNPEKIEENRLKSRERYRERYSKAAREE